MHLNCFLSHVNHDLLKNKESNLSVATVKNELKIPPGFF